MDVQWSAKRRLVYFLGALWLGVTGGGAIGGVAWAIIPCAIGGALIAWAWFVR